MKAKIAYIKSKKYSEDGGIEDDQPPYEITFHAPGYDWALYETVVVLPVEDD